MRRRTDLLFALLLPALLLVCAAVGANVPSAEVSAATTKYSNDPKVQSLQDQMEKLKDGEMLVIPIGGDVDEFE